MKNDNTYYTVKITRHENWINSLNCWSFPLIGVPGMCIYEIRNGSTIIKKNEYHVDYKNQLIKGDDIQNLDHLIIQVKFIKRISTWNNVLITAATGFIGMLLIFLLQIYKSGNSASKSPTNHDSIINDLANRGEKTYTDSTKIFTQTSEKPEKKTNRNIKKETTKITINNPNSRDIILLIGSVTENGNNNEPKYSQDFNAERDITEILRRKQCVIRSSYFDSNVFSNGVFQQLMGTNFSKVPLDTLRKTADEICIGTINRKIRTTVSLSNMFIAEIQLRLIFISLTNGAVTQQFDRIFSSQASFSQESAVAQGNEKMKKFFDENL